MAKVFQSPGNLTEFLNSKRDTAIAAVARWIDGRKYQKIYVTTLFLSLIGLFLGFYYIVHNQDWLPTDVEYRYLYQLYNAIPLIVAVSSLAALLANLFGLVTRNFFILISFIGALLVLQSAETSLWQNISLDSTLANVLVIYGIFFVAYSLVHEKSFNFQFLFMVLISTAVIVTVGALNRSGVPVRGILASQSNRLIFVFSMFISERLSRPKERPELGQTLSLFFTPAHLFTPVPLSFENVRSNDGTTAILKGCYDLIICMVALLIALLIETHYLPEKALQAKESLLHSGTVNYIVYYLRSLSWIGLPIGICRLFGLRMSDYFDKPLLATSPADRWRKWNTYYYQWFYSFIFFPLQKRKHSLFVSVMAVFFATLVLHLGGSNYNLFLPSWSSLADAYLVKATIFFFLHGLLVYIGLKWPQLWPQAKSASGWWGVFALHGLMVLVHIFAP